MRVEQEGRRKLEREAETLRQELKVKEELTGRLAKDFTGIQLNVQKLKEENAAVRERSKAEATARLQALEAAYSSDLQRLQAAHQQAQHQSEISLNSLRSQLEDFKTAQNQESEQMTNLFKQKLSDKDSQITTLRETVRAQIEEIASLRSDLDNLRKKTEGPLAALQGEIEALAKGLRQEQSRCRLILERKDRELDNLRGELRQWQSRSTTL
jgi:chromosome segregation ATPase